MCFYEKYNQKQSMKIKYFYQRGLLMLAQRNSQSYWKYFQSFEKYLWRMLLLQKFEAWNLQLTKKQISSKVFRKTLNLKAFYCTVQILAR